MIMTEGTFELANGILAHVYECEDDLIVEFSFHGNKIMSISYDELADFVDIVGVNTGCIEV